MLIIAIVIVSFISLFLVFYAKLLMKNAEIDMLREHVCYDKNDLHNAWNNGFVEGVHSQEGHETKSFHEWYQMHKFVKRYGK